MVETFQLQQQALSSALGIMQDQQAKIASMQTAMSSRVTDIAALQNAMSTRVSEIAALQAEINARARTIEMGNIALTQTATVAISAGARTLTFTIPGIATYDKTLLFPLAAIPTGYIILGAIASAPNTLQVTLQAPLLAIGATYSITCRVVVIR